MTLHADYLPPAEVADAALAERFPLAMITPKTPPVPQLDVREPAAPAPAQPALILMWPAQDAAPRGVDDGAQVRVFNDRGSWRPVSDDARPGVLVAPMGWWNADYADGRSGQATTSQRLELGDAPTFNDNRVEVNGGSA